MGQIIRARFEYVIPWQLGVKPTQLEKIIARQADLKPLLPVPCKIISEGENRYQCLDSGNNRMVYYMMSRKTASDIFVANYPSEIIRPPLSRKFPRHVLDVAHKSISSNWNDTPPVSEFNIDYKKYFEKLLEKYPYLEDLTSFLNYQIDLKKWEQPIPALIGTAEDLELR